MADNTNDHYLEYFWNIKTGTPVNMICDFVVASIEVGDITLPTFDLRLNHIMQIYLRLQHDGYVNNALGGVNTTANFWELTTKGHVYLISRHPRFKARLQALIDSKSQLWLITSGTIGFIAAVGGIIELVLKLLGK